MMRPDTPPPTLAWTVFSKGLGVRSQTKVSRGTFDDLITSTTRVNYLSRHLVYPGAAIKASAPHTLRSHSHNHTNSHPAMPATSSCCMQVARSSSQHQQDISAAHQPPLGTVHTANQSNLQSASIQPSFGAPNRTARPVNETAEFNLLSKGTPPQPPPIGRLAS